jgi:hypothetical protein
LHHKRRTNVRHPGDFDLTNPPGNRDHYRNQPRVPAGHREGGQWTDGKDRQLSKLRLAYKGSLGPASGLRVPLRTPPNTPSPWTPNTPLPWTPNSPGWPPPGEPERPTLPDSSLISPILALYTWLAARNSDKARAAIFIGREFQRDGLGGEFIPKPVRLLNAEQVKDQCPRLDDVHRYTDEAAESLKLERNNLSSTQYGTKVHSYVERGIKKRE